MGRPGVGVGVIVTSKHHPECVLVGRRAGPIAGTGLLALPGGHLEFGEDWVECGARELLEETGLQLLNGRFAGVTNGVDSSINYHYVTLLVRGETESEPRNMEPQKCEGWFWVRPRDLPADDQLFPALRATFRDQIPPFNVERS